MLADCQHEQMFLLGPALLEVSTRRTLNRLHQTHGVPALAAAAALPALSAALDQHAAAVRDILEHGVEGSTGVPTSVLPVGYARGLLDHLRDAERQAGLSEVDADTHSTPRRAPSVGLRQLAPPPPGRPLPARHLRPA
ncbi:DUF6401 family natural product biosynthesis protein [Nocardia vinacea]|uniref:DUF6401 family natural product biosynthesis protein n=1 Tax=Nocardia vinacea TaxID=96468 RepID=UPI0033E7FA8F